jgi:hypothetical protein
LTWREARIIIEHARYYNEISLVGDETEGELVTKIYIRTVKRVRNVDYDGEEMIDKGRQQPAVR